MPIVLQSAATTVTLELCPWDGKWQDVAGIFALVDDHGAQLKILYIGETRSFAATMPGHPLRARAEYGANSVYAVPVDGDCRSIVADLVARYRPMLQSRPADAERSNAVDQRHDKTGVHKMLDSMTEKIEKEVAPSGINDILDDMFNAASALPPGAVTTHFGSQDSDPTRTGQPRKPAPPRPSLAAGILSKLGIAKN